MLKRPSNDRTGECLEDMQVVQKRQDREQGAARDGPGVERRPDRARVADGHIGICLPALGVGDQIAGCTLGNPAAACRPQWARRRR
eukprot:6099908-Prymnesium_polylepis.2